VNNIPEKTLVLTPHRRISLWDMIHFSATDFALLERLKRTWGELKERQKSEPAGIPTEDERKKLIGLLTKTRELWVKIDLLGETNLISNLEYHLAHVTTRNYSEIAESLRMILLKTHDELNIRSFAYIPIDKAQFFEQYALFGDAVKEKSSDEINAEIRTAGNCLAAELNTAAVFHTIRTAEMGMRRLASRLRVIPCRDSKRIKIEDATWNELIAPINNKIESEKQKPPAERKLKSHFRDYEILVGQLNRLKDDRNEVMHTHGDYKGSEALGVFERVRDFMQRLAKRISLK
jgi:hypothetical protein